MVHGLYVSYTDDYVYQSALCLARPLPSRNLEAFGETLREHRQRAGLSQEKLAAKAGIHRSAKYRTR